MFRSFLQGHQKGKNERFSHFAGWTKPCNLTRCSTTKTSKNCVCFIVVFIFLTVSGRILISSKVCFQMVELWFFSKCLIGIDFQVVSSCYIFFVFKPFLGDCGKIIIRSCRFWLIKVNVSVDHWIPLGHDPSSTWSWETFVTCKIGPASPQCAGLAPSLWNVLICIHVSGHFLWASYPWNLSWCCFFCLGGWQVAWMGMNTSLYIFGFKPFDSDKESAHSKDMICNMAPWGS